MKMLPKMSLLLCAAALAQSAMAQTAPAPIDISVVGTIKPASCNLNLAQTAFDYGQILAGTLSATDPVQLAQKDTTLSVDCGDNAAAVALSVTDGAAGTAMADTLDGAAETGATAFGLGKVGDVAIGGYVMSLSNPQIAGVDAELMTGTAGRADGWTNAGSHVALGTAADKSVSFTTAGGAAPAAGVGFTAALHLQASLNSRTNLGAALTDDVPLQGTSTITMSYL